MRHLPPVAPLLASIAAHVGVLAILFFLVVGESPPSVLFVDLESITERAAPVVTPAPGPSAAGPEKRQAPAGPTRGARRGAGSAPPASSPAEATASTAPPSAPPGEPEPVREPRPQAAPEEPRQPAPAVAIVPAREAPPDVAPRSETSAPTVVPGPSVGSAPGESVASTAQPGGGGRAPAGTGIQGSASGGTGTGSTAGSGGGSAGGAPGAEYGGYLAQVRSRLLEALRYPAPARSRGLTGTVRLEIFIRPDGAIGTVSVASSSSHPLLDEAALEAARSLEPQPFPKGLAPRALRVRLPVVFDLQ